MATKADGELRDACSYYAQKYKYTGDSLERGLEAYATHPFAQEEGFDAVLDGALSSEADLSEYICRQIARSVTQVLSTTQPSPTQKARNNHEAR